MKETSDRGRRTARSKVRDYLLANALFGLALLVYTLWPIALLKWLIVGFVWFMLVSYLAVLTTGSKKPYRHPVPASIGFALDVAFLAAMIYVGWYLTAAAFIGSVLILEAIVQRDRARVHADEA